MMFSKSLPIEQTIYSSLEGQGRDLDLPVIAVLADDELNFGQDLLEQPQLLILPPDRLQVVVSFALELAVQVLDVTIQRPQLNQINSIKVFQVTPAGRIVAPWPCTF